MSDILALFYSELSDDGGVSDALLDERFTLSELMNRSPITIDDGSSVRDAARATSSEAFHSLPVVDADRNLVGIVTSTDLIRYLAGD
jgi:CBS domain-containing protein